MKQSKEKARVYLDTYVLQKDNRVRLPKGIEGNLKVIPGETFFDIYLDSQEDEIILRISSCNK